MSILGSQQLKAFVPTIKPSEAKLFYRDILGLKLLSEDNYALEFDANGTLFRVITVQEFTPHPFTALGWNVNDIKTTIKLLNDKGIKCEKYDFMEQDAAGIWNAPGGAMVAWFKDPDGNVLSLTQ
ncbi:MAG: Glyoxalase/bleomycin resistance protein/dioxygenase [Mucilaginibacter sp.]|nr:Glyoxalase/bleomycin resistance protein/dioxygenase [Mucilaginibacter sp.]